MKRQPRQTEQKKITFHWPKIPLPKFNRYIWILLILAVLLLVLNLFVEPKESKPKIQKVSRARTVEISLAVNDVFEKFDIRDEHISVQDSAVVVKIAENFEFFGMYSILRQQLGEIDAQIIDCRRTNSGAVLMSIGEKMTPVENYLFVKTNRLRQPGGRVAIIIDDFGYSFNPIAREIVTMGFPLTISIIPGLKASSKVADIALLHNKEILVHMPMEPLYEKFNDDGFTLVVDQDPGIASLRIRQAFAQLPMAVGLNNHQGSRATADPELMKTLMTTLGNMGKFFIDSRTNSKSVAYKFAREARVKSNYSSFFIDAKDEDDFIIGQLNQLAKSAKENGNVIAIGHPRRRTLNALKEMLPKLEAMGVTFVPVSELVN